MKVDLNLIFWILVWVVLTLLFSNSLESLLISFYFVTILMPVVFGTSVFFNRFLVTKYLLRGKKNQFVIYFTYMLVVSVYLELLVMVLAFVILADYEIKNLGKIAGDIYLLTLVLYLIVLAEGMILSLKRLKLNSIEMINLHEQLEKDKKPSIEIRVNRKNVVLAISEIWYVESLNDYVNIVTNKDTYTTKEKISKLETTLPSYFLRIHRSFLVNKNFIQSYNREEVMLNDRKLPIGRKYKKDVVLELQPSTV